MSIKCVKSVISVKSTHGDQCVKLLKLLSVKVIKVLNTKSVQVLKMSQVLNVF